MKYQICSLKHPSEKKAKEKKKKKRFTLASLRYDEITLVILDFQ